MTVRQLSSGQKTRHIRLNEITDSSRSTRFSLDTISLVQVVKTAIEAELATFKVNQKTSSSPTRLELRSVRGKINLSASLYLIIIIILTSFG